MPATYSSGSTVVWKSIVEVTFGTTPASPTMKTLRPKPSTMNLKKDTYTTDEVRSDRGVSDVRHGMRKVEGTIEGDLMFLDWDDFLEAAQQGTWTNSVVKTGTNLRSFSLEQGFTDIAQFRVFKGCSVNNLKMSIKPGAMVSVSFGFLGQDMTSAGATAATVTTAAGTASPMSYSNGTINEGGTAIAYITGVDIELDNGLGQSGVVGSNLTPANFNGRANVKGTVTALFKDQTLLNKFLNETESSLLVTMVDPLANQITVIVPRIKYTGGEVQPPKEGPVVISLPFVGLMSKLKTCASLTSLQVTAAAKTFTRVGGSFVTDGFAVGDVITTSSFTNPANNGDFIVTAVTATVLTCAGATGLVDQAAGVGAIISPSIALAIAKY